MSQGLRRECRSCHFPLAVLAEDRRRIDITPGVYVVVNLPEQRVSLICPRCNQRRDFTDVIATTMAVPPHPVGQGVRRSG